MTPAILLFCRLLIHDYGIVGEKEARLLIENTPDFIQALKAKRCPAVEILWTGDHEIALQLRSICTGSPSGLIGNYFVDRHTAGVWGDIDRSKPVHSKRLAKRQRELRKTMRQ